MALVSDSLQGARVAKARITAYYLAQEAIEYIRYTRDTIVLAGGENWLTGSDGQDRLNPCLGQWCKIDVTEDSIDDAIQTCSMPPTSDYVCEPLRYGNPYGFLGSEMPATEFGVKMYQYADGPDTAYERRIRIDETVPDEEARIYVEVHYDPGSVPAGEVSMEEYMYNYQEERLD
jgi:hypothetical protein